MYNESKTFNVPNPLHLPPYWQLANTNNSMILSIPDRQNQVPLILLRYTVHHNREEKLVNSWKGFWFMLTSETVNMHISKTSWMFTVHSKIKIQSWPALMSLLSFSIKNYNYSYIQLQWMGTEKNKIKILYHKSGSYNLCSTVKIF